MWHSHTNDSEEQKEVTMRWHTGIVGVMLVCMAVGSAHGAAFIKFDGVDGESKDQDHQGWSDLSSFRQVQIKPGGTMSGASRRRGDVILEDITCTKELDKASPKIAEAVCKGTVFAKVEIQLTASYTGAGRVTYYKYELSNCWVTHYAISGSGQAEEVPTEEFKIAFEEMTVTYTEHDSAGTPLGTTSYKWIVDGGEAAPELLELGARATEATPEAPQVAYLTRLSGAVSQRSGSY